MTYQQEIQALATELMCDDSTLTLPEARELAREAITDLYRYALTWNDYAASLRTERIAAA